MKALVFHGPGQRSWEDMPDPTVTDPEDAIVRIDAVTICGTDLHILKGDVATVQEPRILGHEAIGTIEAVGPAVRNRNVGDRVLLSCITACARCEYCRKGRYGQCLGGGGWILGHLIDGVQAEYARIPFADTSTHILPESVTNESALLLADILPTSYEVGVLLGRVGPGDSVVIVGAGPIGLAAIRTARLLSPRLIIVVDPAEPRRDAAKAMGADMTVGPEDDVLDLVLGQTDGLGADVVMEAVGIPETFELCTRLVRPCGHLANMGVHGTSATLDLATLWIKDVTITTGLVDTFSTPTLLDMVESGQLRTDDFITHRYGIGEMQDAYDTFSRAAETGALKVGLFR
jgi:alcohol dehydrogenase